MTELCQLVTRGHAPRRCLNFLKVTPFSQGSESPPSCLVTYSSASPAIWNSQHIVRIVLVRPTQDNHFVRIEYSYSRHFQSKIKVIIYTIQFYWETQSVCFRF